MTVRQIYWRRENVLTLEKGRITSVWYKIKNKTLLHFYHASL